SGPTFCATSFAAPTAAGAAAVLFGLDPTATPAVVKQALIDSARPVASWAGKSVSGGVLDLDAAVKLFAERRRITLHSTPPPAATPAPPVPTSPAPPAPTTSPAQTPDKTPPTLRLRLSPTTFGVDARAHIAAAKRRTRAGSTLTMTISEDGGV